MYPDFVDGEKDFYNQDVLVEMAEDDELSIEEQGFMIGYISS